MEELSRASVPAGRHKAFITLAIVATVLGLSYKLWSDFQDWPTAADSFASTSWGTGTLLEQLPNEGSILICEHAGPRWGVFAMGRASPTKFEDWWHMCSQRREMGFHGVWSPADDDEPLRIECLSSRIEDKETAKFLFRKGDTVASFGFQATDKNYQVEFNERTHWFLVIVTTTESRND